VGTAPPIPIRRGLTWAAAFALGALLLYPEAMSLPVLELHKLGHVRGVTVWSGAMDLIDQGEVAVGILVFACSIVVPLLKMAGILTLSWRRQWGSPAARARAHRLIEWAGRWSMLDVLLVAILVAAVKLGNWADIQAGSGVFAFAGVVSLSLMASATFDVRELEAQA
jgi:paraquat-inducible protein A